MFIRYEWNYYNKFQPNKQSKKMSLHLCLSLCGSDYYSMRLKQLSKCATHFHTPAINMPDSAISTQACPVLFYIQLWIRTARPAKCHSTAKKYLNLQKTKSKFADTFQH